MDTLRAIRRSPKHGTMPVMMLTGESDASIVASALTLGVQDFLVKPVDAFILFERMDAALGRAAKEGPLEAEPEPPPDPAAPTGATPGPKVPAKRVLADCVKIRLETCEG